MSPPNLTGSIVAGYFDGDSNLDIAVADSQSLYVLLGNGDGTFQDPVAYGNGFDIQATLATGTSTATRTSTSSRPTARGTPSGSTSATATGRSTSRCRST